MVLPSAVFDDSPAVDGVPQLTVLVGSATAHSVSPEMAPVVIGREAPATILVVDHRVSRNHLVLSIRDGQWLATDPGSTNGTFLHGERVSELVIADDDVTVNLGHPVAGIAIALSTRDAGIVFAGAAVAKRRKELGISQRKLAEEKIINAGALINFEKGRSWPRQSTRASLEAVLDWAPGKIAQLRRDYARGGQTTTVTPLETDPDRTMVVPARDTSGQHGLDPAFLAQWVDQALTRVRQHRAQLPNQTSGDYPTAVARLISELSDLELLVRNASGVPELRSAFLHVRSELREVMLDAASSPTATAGQLLFAARDRARLSVEEAAVLAGVSPSCVKTFESGGTVTAEDAALLHHFAASLR